MYTHHRGEVPSVWQRIKKKTYFYFSPTLKASVSDLFSIWMGGQIFSIVVMKILLIVMLLTNQGNMPQNGGSRTRRWVL